MDTLSIPRELCMHGDPSIEHMQDVQKRKEFSGNFYESLFTRGKYSDVTLTVLGREFRLHKAFLSRSPYFECMFEGSWSERTAASINIDIIDPCITQDAISATFASLYYNYILATPAETFSILATASMFLLTELIEKCVEIIEEATNYKTVVLFYQAADRYSITKLEEKCLRWLRMFYRKYPIFPPSVMTKVLQHSQIYAESEKHVYDVLKYWIYYGCHEVCSVNIETVNDFFRSRTDNEPFLLTEEGEQYLETFKTLRLQYLFQDRETIDEIILDKIIPMSWLENWQASNQLYEIRVFRPMDVTEEYFLRNCKRLTYVTRGIGEMKWTDSLFGSYALNFQVIGSEMVVFIKRFIGPVDTPKTLRHKQIALRLTIVRTSRSEQITHWISSPILILELEPLRAVQIMRLEYLSFPVIAVFQALYSAPNNMDAEPTSSE